MKSTPAIALLGFQSDEVFQRVDGVAALFDCINHMS
jgi:hypothetical protein